MRLFICACLLLIAAPCASLAQQSTTPGYTAFDQQQFAKLRAWVGTWNCTDVPASKKTDVITTVQQGNWFVSHETGDSPSTTYTRWSHGYQTYFSVIMDPLGDMNVATTDSKEPSNATWQVRWPPTFPNKRPQRPFAIRLSGNTLITTGSYYDDKGKLVRYKSTCVKQI